MQLSHVTARLGLLVTLALAGCGGDPGMAPPLPEEEAAALEAALQAEQNGEAASESPPES